MQLPATVMAVAIAALINVWLAVRVGQFRGKYKVIHGDDGGGPLTRRMRAQLNYVENAPFFLLLVLAIELEGNGGLWLAIVTLVFFLARILHALGMDGEEVTTLRKVGVSVNLLAMVGLAIYAILNWFHVV